MEKQPTDTSEKKESKQNKVKKKKTQNPNPSKTQHSIKDLKNNYPSLSSADWMQISHDLQDKHALFYECWNLGRPVFTNTIKTACVGFNEKGDFLEFLFNPDFWLSKTPYERLFIICHECLHVALNHGIRILNQTNPAATNVTLDIVVNHALVRDFGFRRERIKNWQELCWTDTVFPKMRMSSNEQFEYYYNRLPKQKVLEAFIIVDDHGKLINGDGSANTGKIIKKLNERLSPEEKESIKKLIEKHGTLNSEGSCGSESEGDEEGGLNAGLGTGHWDFADIGKVRPKKKWETIIKKWSKRYLNEEGESEQWARINRRISGVSSELIIPSEMEEAAISDKKIEVFFFLDTSGSCYHLKDRFFAAALSLPKERFDVRLFCFDTRVEETDLVSRRIYGGGGTNFQIIEDAIQRVITNEKKRYPEAVFIITDGYGTRVQPKKEEAWYWFLTPQNSKQYIPKSSKTFNLKDYE